MKENVEGCLCIPEKKTYIAQMIKYTQTSTHWNIMDNHPTTESAMEYLQETTP